MTVYVDELQDARPYQSRDYPYKYFCHLTADSTEELKAFAARIALKSEWFQDKSTPHFDLTKSRRDLALKAGAVFKSAREQAAERIAAWRKREEAKQ